MSLPSGNRALVAQPLRPPWDVPRSAASAVPEHRMARWLPAWALAAVGALVWLVAAPLTPDLAAHEYRAAVFRRVGLSVWEQGWYGGHALPGYSVLMPPLAALLSPQFAAVLAAVIAAWCFQRLADGHWAAGAAKAAGICFAIGVVSVLVGGQLTFATALAPALGALLAARCGHLWLAGALGAATTLTSPVAAAFLVLACVAWWLGARGRGSMIVAAATIAPGVLIVLAFPEGGAQPFGTSAFTAALAVALGLFAVLHREERVLRTSAVLYSAALILGFELATPLGGNLVRLAAVFGLPLAAGALWGRHRGLLVLLVLPLLYAQWLEPLRSLQRDSGDPSAASGYHAPLLAELDRRAATEGPFRTEIPFTADHWETRYISLTHPLARGWERQLDTKLNPLFYDGTPLTPARYVSWLHNLAVRYVALPDVRLDRAGLAEGRLLAGGRVPGLRQVWHSAHWRLFRVDHATGLASPPVRVTAIGLDTINLTTPSAATATVRVRFTPYWVLARGHGCVAPTRDGWTSVRLTAGGPARLAIRFALDRVRATSPRCTA